MYLIAPHQPAVTIFDQSGVVRKFASLAEALRCYGYNWICANVGSHFCEFSHNNRTYDLDNACVRIEPVYDRRPFIMRDDAGDIVAPGNFAEIAKAQRSAATRARIYARYRYMYPFWNGEGPVPGTGRCGNYHYFRHPGTHNLRRSAAFFAEEGEVAPRAKRNAAGIPTAWDDYGRSDIGNRSWKRHRDTQWKG